MTVVIFCSGELRTLPVAIWNALWGPKPPVPHEFICNGCTMSPDFLFGKRAWPACVIHDYHYNETSLSRLVADQLFRENLKISLKADGMPGFLAATLAWGYYRAVRRAGKSRYHGAGDPS